MSIELNGLGNTAYALKQEGAGRYLNAQVLERPTASGSTTDEHQPSERLLAIGQTVELPPYMKRVVP